MRPTILILTLSALLVGGGCLPDTGSTTSGETEGPTATLEGYGLSLADGTAVPAEGLSLRHAPDDACPHDFREILVSGPADACWALTEIHPDWISMPTSGAANEPILVQYNCDPRGLTGDMTWDLELVGVTETSELPPDMNEGPRGLLEEIDAADSGPGSCDMIGPVNPENPHVEAAAVGSLRLEVVLQD